MTVTQSAQCLRTKHPPPPSPLRERDSPSPVTIPTRHRGIPRLSSTPCENNEPRPAILLLITPSENTMGDSTPRKKTGSESAEGAYVPCRWASGHPSRTLETKRSDLVALITDFVLREILPVTRTSAGCPSCSAHCTDLPSVSKEPHLAPICLGHDLTCEYIQLTASLRSLTLPCVWS